MPIDLWDWFNEFKRNAQRAGDLGRLQLPQLYNRAQPIFETNPRQALTLLEQGRASADRLSEPCWVLFFDFWRCALYMNFLDDKTTALNLAVETAVEARKPMYQACPVRSRVQSILVDAYLTTDPLGYANKIHEALDYLEAEGPLDLDVWQQIEMKRAWLALWSGRLEEAQQAAERHLARCEGNHFRLTHAYALLCEIVYRRGNLNSALEYARAGEANARRSKQQRVLTEILCWQALFARQRGDERTALQLYRLAMANSAQLGRKLSYAYYDALCEFYVLGDEPERALQLRNVQLEQVSNSGSPWAECECRLRRCQLLAQMGRPLDDELAQARQAARKLINPAPFLSKLESLAHP
jgi:hypothetical protein